MATVQALAGERDQAMLDRITYWDAGAPYRWIQRSVKYMEDHGVTTARAGRVLALFTVAMYDGTISAWDATYPLNRRRPSEIDPSLAAIAPPASPSYPDERAAAAGAASTVDAADGLTLGQQIGQLAVEWGRADGSDAVWTGSVPTGEYYGGRAGFECWNDQATRTIADYHLDLDPPAGARFLTPNPPSYPSAHSCISGSYAGILGRFFPP